MNDTELTLAGSLFLIAYDNESGRLLANSGAFGFAVDSAVIMELVLREKMTVDKDGTVKVTDASPTGDPLLDEFLSEIDGDSKQRSLTDWIQKLNVTEKRMTARLVRAGDLNVEESKFLFFKSTKHVADADSRQYRREDQLRAAVRNPETCTARDAMLLSLLKACDLLSVVFTKNDLLRFESVIEDLTEGDAFANAVGGLVDAVEAMRASQAAMMSAISASMITTTMVINT